MKYLFIGIFALIPNSKSYLDAYGVMTGKIGNVYYSGICAGETQYQNGAIAYLCFSYLKKFYPHNKEKIFLELGFEEKEVSYKISYDKYEGKAWKESKNSVIPNCLGIRIRTSSKYNRAESVLKLMDYGLKHLKELKILRKNYNKIDENDRPVGYNVDSITLSQIIKSPISENINTILSTKVFRNLGKEEYGVSKEYFFQYDLYHFIDYFNKDSVYIKLKQIYQIISEHNLGTIIFETDSTGYFYNRESKKLSTRFKILDKKSSFYYTHTSSDEDKKRIYFEYDSYEGEKKKFIYLIDKLILIQKVNENEDLFIKKAIEK